jgi:DNA polymerase-3 subunit delta
MIFALIGEEALLVRRALERLLAERLPPAARDFNFDRFEGREVEARKIAEIAKTLPVLSPRRLLLIREAEAIKKGELERLEPLLVSLPETTDLVFAAGKVDRRLRFWQRVAEFGKVREFRPLYPREVPAWVAEEAGSRGFRIDADAVSWLVAALGTDLSLLHATLEKLDLLRGDRKAVSLPEVEACVAAFSWKSVFDLTDAVGRKDLGQAAALFKRMFAAGESPVALLALLARHFRILLKVKEGGTAGIPPFFLKDYQRQSSAFRKEELLEKNERLFHADWALKSSPLPSTILFEQLLFDLCRPS